MPAPKYKQACKNLEACFIGVQKPSLNEQLKSNVFNNFSDFLLSFLFIL